MKPDAVVKSKELKKIKIIIIIKKGLKYLHKYLYCKSSGDLETVQKCQHKFSGMKKYGGLPPQKRNH